MFNLILVQPLYNVFIYLVGLFSGDVGLAIIVLTLIVRAIFYPVFASSIRTSMAMQAVRPELDEINEKYKDNLEERSRRTLELYRKHRIRPFSSILSALVQLVVLIALYWALFHTGLPQISSALLYPLVTAPAVVNTQFLGIDLFSAHNIPLTVVVVALQYLVMRYSLARMSLPQKQGDTASAMAQRMQNYMMLYFLPLVMAFVTYTFPAAVGLYFAVSNVISLGQEWLIRRQPL